MLTGTYCKRLSRWNLDCSAHTLGSFILYFECKLHLKNPRAQGISNLRQTVKNLQHHMLKDTSFPDHFDHNQRHSFVNLIDDVEGIISTAAVSVSVHFEHQMLERAKKIGWVERFKENEEE